MGDRPQMAYHWYCEGMLPTPATQVSSRPVLVNPGAGPEAAG
ncbi:MAG TPA: hypothetical protein VGD91_07605 [Trebonia sp.]